jgi:hypothetical protein
VRLAARLMRCNGAVPNHEANMKTNLPDPNAELYTREPLRIAFAVLALILGVVVSLHV